MIYPLAYSSEKAQAIKELEGTLPTCRWQPFKEMRPDWKPFEEEWFPKIFVEE
jgi:hypothetical protein